MQGSWREVQIRTELVGGLVLERRTQLLRVFELLTDGKETITAFALKRSKNCAEQKTPRMMILRSLESETCSSPGSARVSMSEEEGEDEAFSFDALSTSPSLPPSVLEVLLRLNAL